MKSPDLSRRSGDKYIGIGERFLEAPIHSARPILESQPRRLRLPAYGAQLAAAQRQGLNVPWLLIVIGDWRLGVACPRVLVPDDMQVDEIDLRIVHNLQVIVAHRGQHERALRVAALALSSGAQLAPVIDLVTSRVTSTSEIAAAWGRGRAAA
jgi:hypothetical protein